MLLLEPHSDPRSRLDLLAGPRALLDDRVVGRDHALHVFVDDAGLEELALRGLEREPANVRNCDGVARLFAASGGEPDCEERQGEPHGWSTRPYSDLFNPVSS